MDIVDEIRRCQNSSQREHKAADEIQRLRDAIDYAGTLACQNASAELIRSKLAEAKNW